MKFARFLRAKYAALDSLSRLYRSSLHPYLKFQISSEKLFDLDVKRWGNPEFWHNGVSRDDWLRARGGSQQVLLGPAQFFAAFQKNSPWERSKRKFSRNVIPSNLQLNVLTSLWENSEATQQELYLALSSEYAITAEKLDKQLTRMLDLGLVERKIISPQNTLMVLTPLKSFQIELSRKNRKNRVYLYRPRVKREEMLRVLLMKMEQVKNWGQGRTGELKKLNQKVKIILPNGGE